jgi:hypothetical protein
VTFSKVNSNPRIGYVAPVNITGRPVRYWCGGEFVSVPEYSQVLFAGVDGVEGLTWSLLLKTFFRLWLGSMERYKLIRAHFGLTDSDVYQFDFTRAKYVSKFGSNFYVQRINKYVGPTESTEIEMLKLGEPIAENKIKPL